MNRTQMILIIGFVLVFSLILGLYLYETKEERCFKRILKNNPEYIRIDPMVVARKFNYYNF